MGDALECGELWGDTKVGVWARDHLLDITFDEH